MDPNDLVARIRDGDADNAISAFLAANPAITFENLVGGAIKWGLDDVSEILLRRLLQDQPDHEAAHDHLAELLYRQKRFEDSVPHYQFLCARFPDRAPAYSRLCWVYFELRDTARLREAVHAAQRHIADGHHLSWQAGAPVAFYLSPDEAAAHSARHKAVCDALAESRRRNLVPPLPAAAPAPAERVLSAATLGASEFGHDAAILSAAVGSTFDEAEYRFEYGPSPKEMSGTSPWRPMPGNLNAQFITSPNDTPTVYSLYAASLSWNEKAGAYVMDWPFGKDPNHVSGIGFLELICGLWPNSCQFDGNQQHMPYETGDLRDAELTLQLHAQDIDAKDFLFCVGVGNVSTYWMLSAAPFDLSAPQGDGMTEISVRLTSDPASWTAFGNNPREQSNADRYGHGPLHDALSNHMGNLVLTATFGDWRDTLTGRLGIRRAVLKYRDKSVLHPDSGTVLIESPAGPCDPANLANGRRGTPDAGWFHAGPVTEPPVFRWRLAKPWTISTLVLHQDTVWPTRKCRIGVTAADGQSHSWEIEPPCGNDPLVGLRQFVIRLPAVGPCREFFIEFLEGAATDGLGLEAIELFATDYVPPPSPVPASVSEEVAGLRPGSTVCYRVACRAGDKTEWGETETIVLPADDMPVLHDIRLHAVSGNKAVIQVRANAMGHDTAIRWQVDDGDWRETTLGWEKTAAHRYLQVHAPVAGDHRVAVFLKSEAGESPARSISFTTP
jgi:hypothetical protein